MTASDRVYGPNGADSGPGKGAARNGVIQRSEGDLRQPPHDLAAEQSTLGGMLLSRDAIPDVVESLAGPQDFYRPTHQTLYEVILDLYGRGEPADPVMVSAELNRRGMLNRLGGAPYLHTLIETVPTATNAAYYAEIVAEKAILRRLVEAGTRIVQLGYHGAEQGDAVEVVEKSRASLDAVALVARGGTKAAEIDTLAEAALVRYANPAPAGVATGFHDLDAVIGGGLRPGTLTVIGARPGTGKTVVGTCIALNAARRGTGALFVSLEMTEDELTDRVLANLGSIRLNRLIAHQLSDVDWSMLQEAIDRMQGMPLAIVDNPHLGLVGIRSLARDRLRTARGLGLLVVDYLSLMAPADPKAPRHEQVAAMSRGLKLLAKELAVPVVALHQLNRNPEGRQDRRPSMSDLRESGAVEQDADNVWLLHRTDLTNRDDPRAGEIDVIVAKNRQGAAGVVTESWVPHYARVSSLARVEEVPV
jgi:replicative DNA helicase